MGQRTLSRDPYSELNISPYCTFSDQNQNGCLDQNELRKSKIWIGVKTKCQNSKLRVGSERTSEIKRLTSITRRSLQIQFSTPFSSSPPHSSTPLNGWTPSLSSSAVSTKTTSSVWPEDMSTDLFSANVGIAIRQASGPYTFNNSNRRRRGRAGGRPFLQSFIPSSVVSFLLSCIVGKWLYNV